MKNIKLAILMVLVLAITIGCGQKAVEIKTDADGFGKTTLPNGITLLVNHDQSTSLSAGRILFGGGILTESKENSGISNIMIRMLLKGNDEMTAAQVSEQLDFLGANVATGCNNDYSFISFVSLTENFEQAEEVISRSILFPSFPEEELAKLKTEIEGDLKSEEDNQSTASSKLYWKTAFGDNAYGLPSSGTRESIASITVEDLRAHYDSYIGGKNTIMAVVSDMTPERLATLVQGSFGSMKAESYEITAPGFALQEETLGFKSFDRNQSFIFTGIMMEKPAPREACYLSLLDEIMGSGPGARLWYLRQDEKLAYAVYTQELFRKYCASFRAAIGTDTSKVNRAISSLDREWEKMAKEGITEDEITDAKINLKNTWMFRFDTKGNRAFNMAYFEHIGYGYKFIPEMLKKIDDISQSELNDYIYSKMAPGKRFTSIVGKK